MNLLRKLPIRGQMYMIAALTMGVFVMILLFNYNRSASFIAKNNEVYTNDIFNQMEQTILSNYDVVKWLTYNIAYNQSIQDYLLDQDILSKYQRYPTIKNLFLNLSTVSRGISDFVVIGKNGDSFSLQGSTAERIRGLHAEESGLLLLEGAGMQEPCRHLELLLRRRHEYFLQRSQAGVYERNRPHHSPYRRFDANRRLSPQIAAARNEHLLIGPDDTIFMSNDRKKIGQPFQLPAMTENSGVVRLNGVLTHIQVDELPQVGGRIVRVIPDDVFFKDIPCKLRRETLLALAAGILLLAVPFLLILNNMILPMRKLFQYLRISDSGEYQQADRSEGFRGSGRHRQPIQSDAVRPAAFDEAARALERTIVQDGNREEAGRIPFFEKPGQSAFSVQPARFDPRHRLGTRRSGNSRDDLVALADLPVHSVKGHDIVPLKDELRIVEAFMNIQMIRFSHRFRFLARIPEAL